jgi:hypothetical protein
MHGVKFLTNLNLSTHFSYSKYIQMRRECVHLDALSFPRRKNINLIKLLKIYLHQALTSVWARDTHKSGCTRAALDNHS